MNLDIEYIVGINKLLKIVESIDYYLIINGDKQYDVWIKHVEERDTGKLFCNNFVESSIIKTIRLLKIAMKRWRMKSSLKKRCRTIIKKNEIDYMNENISQDLKEYLSK